ncbi:MAG TPA: lipid-binding SYLF domain-containing protein [Geobacteraceae bacterium]
MKIKTALVVAVAVLATIVGRVSSVSAEDGTKTVYEAVGVLKEIMAIPEKGIPPALLSNAYGIAIVPGVIKLGFIVGGRYGTGVLAVRGENGAWSSPAFVSLAGGGIGWQIGAQSTDIILVFKSRRSIDGIMKGKFTLGADASVAAGPVGRNLEAATDVKLKSEIYSYSRSRGLFAGISLEGAALEIDKDVNATFYGKKDIRAADILNGKVHSDSAAVRELQKLLRDYASAE